MSRNVINKTAIQCLEEWLDSYLNFEKLPKKGIFWLDTIKFLCQRFSNPQKSFNRGFTHYFLKERKPHSIASIHTPKSLGELLIDTKNILSSDLNYLIVNFYNNNGNNVKFSFDKNIFLENLYQKL